MFTRFKINITKNTVWNINVNKDINKIPINNPQQKLSSDTPII